MLTTIMIFSIITCIFTISCAGHLSNIEKLTKAMVQAKVAEMNMFNGKH